MADDIKFSVDYSDLSRSLDILMEMGKASKNTATAFEQSFRQIKRWQDTFKGQQGKINAQLETTHQKLNLANKSAKQSAQAFIAHEKAIEGNTNALNKFRSSYDSTYATEQRTLQLKKLLRQEIANGNMTVREAGAELLKYRKNLQQFNTSQMAATKSSNRMGVVTQQAGYQVSDFIVQVQSGTNPFVAFSQQASQLAGVLPLVADRMGMTATRAIALSTALGIGIPIIGAIGAFLLTTSRNASDASDSINTFEDAIGKAEDSLAKFMDTAERLEDEDLASQFGSMADQVEGLDRALLPLQSKLAALSVTAAFEKLNTDIETNLTLSERSLSFYDKYLSKYQNFAALVLKTPLATPVDIDPVQQGLKNIGLGMLSPVDINDIQANLDLGNYERAATLVQQAIDKAVGSSDKLGTSAIQFLLNMRQVVTTAAELKGQLDGSANSAELLADRTDFIDNLQKAVNYSATLYGQTNDQIDASNDKLDFQNDLLALGLNANDHLYQKALQLYGQLTSNEKAAKDFADALEDAAEAGEKLTELDTDLDTELAKVDAQIQAIKTNQDVATASFIAGEQAKATAAYETAKALYTQTGNIVALAEATLTFVDMMEKLELLKGKRGELASLKDLNKGSKKETGKEYAESQLREAQNKRLVASLTGEQAKYEELLFKLQEANAKKRDPLSEKEIQDYARKIQGINKQTEAFEKQKKVQEELKATIEDSMGDAFMSIIDGTKSVEDAFRDMARQIIAELMRVLVVKQMVSAATGFFGFADGGAFQGGSQIQAYANGGVVGSPTYFPMAGGRTGLMGEAGPEAIMPLKRGKDGKLGVTVDGNQQQSVNIVQNFQFSANGDDSVKRIIASEAPKIAKMTEAQILENRRRGGQFRKAFYTRIW